MTIDINKVLGSIESLLLGSLASNLPSVTSVISQYIADAKDRLPEIAKGALSGDLTYVQVVSYLKDEEVTLKDQLISLGLIVGSDLQALVNKAIGIFENALKAAIPSN